MRSSFSLFPSVPSCSLLFPSVPFCSLLFPSVPFCSNSVILWIQSSCPLRFQNR